jgi:RimJ/RimL family protein N-acetyltransferase
MARLQAFHRRLSPDAIRLRFHSYLPEPPDDLARRFCEVDSWNRVAFVATFPADESGELDAPGSPITSQHPLGSGSERIVAVGRFDREGEDAAEVAFVVEDGCQGRGLGSRLLRLLIAAARERGIRTLVAHTLPGNTRMRRLLERAGYPLRMQRGKDEDFLWLEIGG